ncbi:hypothetical protein DQ244_06175 [Blastococcus sp. TBT05-19]|uniref:GGDEF domain-containing protein n=1 Tax=Blastococcus sp. TBT05-19 TaxID=2250581 RepID=UPI000DE91491|nr:GGDEF domain-containing protein [Blastococcus sp. TBT05-19]RBY94841.1 hypothetical protein DQ244_06175 [Blastococcus sp. TBT05-19]
MRAGLYRTLAEDDDRAAYWVRHVRYGVIQSEIAAVAVAVYTALTPTPIRGNPVIFVLAALVVVGSPMLMLLPLREMMRDNRGPLLMYSWSISTTALITVAARLDGGASSPLFSVLFLTLAFMAVAYAPYGVVAMGALMTGSYLAFVAMPDITLSALFFATVMGSFTMICAMASANSWAAYDRQLLLIRTQKLLASTDPLTGIPNRRLFLDRVAGAVDASAWGHRSVALLVDLDGFKAVNDAEGHAAGDALLTAVGAALGAAVRETDTVARLGGDEFGVLADVTSGTSAALLAERLREAVAVAGARHRVTASVGLAEIHPGDDVEDLMHRADVAMYRAKSSGGNRAQSLDV